MLFYRGSSASPCTSHEGGDIWTVVFQAIVE